MTRARLFHEAWGAVIDRQLRSKRRSEIREDLNHPWHGHARGYAKACRASMERKS